MGKHLAMVAFACCSVLSAQEAEKGRLKAAADVLTAILGSPDKGSRGTCSTRRNAHWSFLL